MGLSEDLDRVSLQERELQFESMDEQTAWEIGSRLRALAVSVDSPSSSTFAASASRCSIPH